MEPSEVLRPSPGPRLVVERSAPQEVPVYGMDDPHNSGEVPQRVRASRTSQIRGVSVLPPRENSQGGKNVFRIMLSLDAATNPSSHTRRTGTVSSIELEVEEKDLQPLARLTGRSVLVHYLLWTLDVQSDALQQENAELREEVQALKRKLRMTQDQLQHIVEGQVRDQRF